MLNFLPGKKTYIVGTLMVLWGGASLFAPDLGSLPLAEDPGLAIMEGLALLGLRKAID